METSAVYPLRVYPMDPQELSEEQIAVIFAMTSRRPEPFDEIRKLVTEEKAADFHERWVLNYGHASVAEHAIIHMAVENLSRLACDTLEDNRLASYTEKSSRYQVFHTDYYHVPQELAATSLRRRTYLQSCQQLFDFYERMVESLRVHLKTLRPQIKDERDGAYNLRLRREATDTCRFVLPAATLTNVGVTLNARTMEHAIRKLLSADLAEEQALGELLKREGLRVTPTLIKYADRNNYLVKTRRSQWEAGVSIKSATKHSGVNATLVHFDPEAELKVAAAFLYRYSHKTYQEVLEHVRELSNGERGALIDSALEHLGGHDVPIRELEAIYYTFELTLDYGAYREFKRHRMQTYMPQPATIGLGYVVPPLIEEANLGDLFEKAMHVAEKGFEAVAQERLDVAQYLVTHAHRRRVIVTLNLRECYHLFKLRTQPTAHFSLVSVIAEALDLAQQQHGALFKHLRLRAP